MRSDTRPRKKGRLDFEPALPTRETAAEPSCEKLLHPRMLLQHRAGVGMHKESGEEKAGDIRKSLRYRQNIRAGSAGLLEIDGGDLRKVGAGGGSAMCAFCRGVRDSDDQRGAREKGKSKMSSDPVFR